MTKHKLVFRNVAFCLLLAAIILGACAPKVEKLPLKIGWSLFPGWYPMPIAVEQGYFTQRGVEVIPVFYDVYAETLLELQSGVLDGALITLSDALLLEAQSPGQYKIVMVTDNSTGADAVVAPPEIKSVADLKGKTVGASLGTFGELLIIKMLEANGMAITDVHLVDTAPEGVPAAVQNEIQAGHTWEPFLTQALSNGAHVLFSSAETPGLIADVLVVRSSVIENNPDGVRAFIAAWFDAQNYWLENSQDANLIIGKETGLKENEISSQGIKLFNLADNLATFNVSEDITSVYGSSQINLEFFAKAGEISFKPDLDQLLDPSFLK
jgi:NitT/TauT family transport system substrate-binding protein